MLGEVSLSTLMELERALFEANAQAHEIVGLLSPVPCTELRGAGLLRRGESGTLEPFDPRILSELGVAVSAAVASQTDAPPGFGEIAEHLFSIERMIRLQIRLHETSIRGDRWRRDLLSAHVEREVVDRAQLDAFPNVTKAHQLRDPLEWLSLGELLEIAHRLRLLGKGERYWSTIKRDLSPIRNRISHMRLPLEEDRRTAKRIWHQIASLCQ